MIPYGMTFYILELLFVCFFALVLDLIEMLKK